MTTATTQDRDLWLRLSRLLGALGTVRSDERRDVFGAFLTLFAFMSGHALMETARDALFLAELRASLLPWVYLTLAAATLLLTRYHGRLARILPRGQELSGWLVFAAATTAVLWLTIFWAGDWIFYILYAWTGVLATLVVIQFWTLLSSLFTLTQAKRLFAVIGTGSIMGAIWGSAFARVLTEIVPAQHLVIVAAAIFLLASFGPRLIASTPATDSLARPQALSSSEMGHVGRMVWTRPYLRRVALVLLLATITFTLVDYIFKSTVARVVPDESLGEFFSGTYLSLNLVSLVIQVTTVGWILRRVTVSTALAIVPVLLVVGAVGFIASGGLLAALLLKGADGSLRYSLYRTTTELLFVPISAEIRGRVKAFIDVVGQRGGQAAGSLLVLIVLSLTTSEVGIAILAVAAGAGWLYLIVVLRPYYLDLFRQTLKEDVTATRIEFPALDVASLETLLYTLNSPDERQVRAALDLLAEQSKIRVVPGLILYHPSPDVVTRALGLFAAAGRDDVLPLIDRLASDPNERVRAASLGARTILAPDESRLNAGLKDPSLAVRATAAVGIVARGWAGIALHRPLLEEAAASEQRLAQLALAEAVRSLPDRAFAGILLRLTESADAEVRLASVRAMRSIADPELIDALIGLLGRRQLRIEARAALVDLGPRALVSLSKALEDAAVSHGIRRHLPRTIAAFGTPQAAALLLRHLQAESDGMVRFKVLRALGKMRSVNSGLVLDAEAISQAIEQNLNAAFRYLRWRHALMPGLQDAGDSCREQYRLLLELLEDKQAHTLQRLFRLLNLQANDEEFLRIYRGLKSARREARAGSRELIEHLVNPQLARAILTIVDDLYDPASHRDASDNGGRAREPGNTLRELALSRIESLSSLALAIAGRLRLKALAGTFVGIAPLSDSHAGILREALRMLREPLPGGAGNG